MKSAFPFTILLCYLISCSISRQREEELLSPFFIYSFNKCYGDSVTSISGDELSSFCNLYYRTPKTKDELIQFINRQYGNNRFIESQIRKITELKSISIDSCLVVLFDRSYLLHDTPCERLRMYYSDSSSSIPETLPSFLNDMGNALTEESDSLEKCFYKALNRYIIDNKFNNRVLLKRRKDTVIYRTLFYYNGIELIEYCNPIKDKLFLGFTYDSLGHRIIPINNDPEVICYDYLSGLKVLCESFVELNQNVSTFFFRSGLFY